MKHKTSVMAQRNSKNSHIKKIGLVTGGGDCPGLNAVIRAVVISAINRGWEVYGIEHGFEGLLYRNRVHLLNTHDVRGIIHTGGTILGTTNRGNPFKLKVTEDGETRFIDISDKVVEQFHSHELESLIVIGGDGTLSIASDLAKKGIPVIGVPKTIDNDLMATEMTFGFSTAVATATDAIDKLHATAASHERVMIVEVMGRYAGWIALYSGVAGGSDVILIPEIPYPLEPIGRKLHDRWRRKRNSAIIVAAEGAAPVGGEMIFKASEDGREPRLGGIAERLADDHRQAAGDQIRRGGSPRHRVRKEERHGRPPIVKHHHRPSRDRDPQTQTGPAGLRRHPVGARSGSLFRRRII